MIDLFTLFKLEDDRLKTTPIGKVINETERKMFSIANVLEHLLEISDNDKQRLLKIIKEK